MVPFDWGSTQTTVSRIISLPQLHFQDSNEDNAYGESTLVWHWFAVLAEEVSSSDLTVGESILTADKWRCPR